MKKLFVSVVALLSVAVLFAQATGTAGNKLKESTGTAVSVVTDLDYSKKKPAAIKNQSAELSSFADAECLKVSNAKQRLVRFAFVFDEPVSTDDLASMKFSLAGFSGYEGFWNIGLMYEDMNGAEHAISCYTGTVSDKKWTDFNLDLTADEVWGHSFKPGKKVIGIQFYSDQTKTVYIKDLELTKK